MSVLQIAIGADSIGRGHIGGFDYEGGGLGNYEEQVADRLANISGIGPVIGPGCKLMYTDGVRVGSWTGTVSTDVFDRAIFGTAYYSAGGSGTTITWNVPAHWRPIVGFCVYWIDYTNAGDFQYSVDGGAWVNMGQTINNNNKLKKFYVASAITSSVAFRAYNGATSVGCMVAFIEPFFVDPRSATTGVIVHNLGYAGNYLINFAGLSSSGDRLAWFDDVTLGTGSPPSNRPSICIFGTFSNDCALAPASTTDWVTELTAVRNRVSSYASVGFINVYEQGGVRLDGTNCTGADQATWRAALASTAASFSCPVLDIYSEWSKMGYTGFAGAVVAGFMNNGGVDTLHLSQIGDNDVANRLYWLIRNNFLSVGNTPTVYPQKAKAASVAYTAKAASKAYTAGAPIAIN